MILTVNDCICISINICLRNHQQYDIIARFYANVKVAIHVCKSCYMILAYFDLLDESQFVDHIQLTDFELISIFLVISHIHVYIKSFS